MGAGLGGGFVDGSGVGFDGGLLVGGGGGGTTTLIVVCCKRRSQSELSSAFTYFKESYVILYTLGSPHSRLTSHLFPDDETVCWKHAPS